jgi:hypothetical protein
MHTTIEPACLVPNHPFSRVEQRLGQGEDAIDPVGVLSDGRFAAEKVVVHRRKRDADADRGPLIALAIALRGRSRVDSASTIS